LERVTGETVALADYLGQPVLLNFFASWCANCREEMAALDAASKQEVTVIGVNLRESRETVTRLAAETGASFPLLLDRKGAVTRAYRVSNLPVTFAIDASGTVRDIVLGPVDADRLDALIHAARAGSGVEGEATR
jgi:peroxiredoxin